MELLFNSDEILNRGRGLTFEDVIMIPQHSEVSSRKDPDLTTRLTRNYEGTIPLIAANMDTITESQMAFEMALAGGLGILHRFMTIEQQVEQVKIIEQAQKEKGLKTPLAASIGVKEEGKKRCDHLIDAGVKIITLDIAHGDSVMMLDVLSYVKNKYPNIDIIAGNVATTSGTARLIDNGADAIKVGIGPGSMCTTRIITGHGVPQLTAIALCVKEAKKHNIPVIADGGVKTSGDIVKALAAGADSVMVGSLLAGTLETPGEVQGGKKLYRGMASQSAQVSWRGELPTGMTAEGESTRIACKGPVADVVHELMGGLRSGMTYLGTKEIKQMSVCAQFMEMSQAGLFESRPHGLNS